MEHQSHTPNSTEPSRFLQKELASAVGISESHMSLILSGRRDPSMRVWQKMREVLGLTADQMVNYLQECRKNNCEKSEKSA